MATHMANIAIAPGEYVYVGNKLCYCLKITNNLGFNLYEVVVDDTGEKMTKARHELIITERNFLNMHEPFDDVQGDKLLQNDEKPPEIKKKRFADVTKEDLDTYAINKNSKHTRNQTLWGVAIFKGKGTLEKCALL